jgi:imidazolonepropionase-like amidohydrolase
VRFPRTFRFAVISLALTACGGAAPHTTESPPDEGPVLLDPPVEPTPPAFDAPLPAPPAVLIRDAEVLTAAGHHWKQGWLRLKDGRISALGEGAAPAPEAGETVVEARGRFVTPGLIDTHSHLGVYASPGIWAHADGNEMTNPMTPGIRAEEAVWPQDPGIERAVAGGVTTMQVLPGSGNLMGGQGTILKLHPRREAAAMRFPGAPVTLKMACGENPKRVYGEGKGAMPMSRMGSLYLVRQKFLEARRYKLRWDQWRKKPYEMKDGKKVPTNPPDRDLHLEALARVMAGEILPQIHCYRADEMLLQIKLSHEFGYRIRSFHHALEAYKIADVLARERISVSTWADWWGFKIEAWDAVEQNLALVQAAGGIPVLHTDSPEGIQRMNQEAAKAMTSGRAAGIPVTEDQALRWITANPAWALGIEGQTGSLEAGKMADVVVWDAHPFSVYARAEQVYVDGHLRHDRRPGAAPRAPWSDFEVYR